MFKKKNKTINTISSMAKDALGRGGGRACVATHAGGCKHYGILDLHPMDHWNFVYYTREGEWLSDKCCISCQSKAIMLKMDKGTKVYLRYCEMGLKSLKYDKDGDEDEKDMYENHHCLLVLCVPCWNMKVLEHENMATSASPNEQRCYSARRK